jgi:ribosome maturation factor RimP
MELKENITQWIAPYLEEHDLFLVDIKIQGGKKVEVYVDSDTGIAVGRCVDISRLLENHLDGSGMLSENYMLDVSSPGMSNPLIVPRQYKRRIGRTFDIVKTDGTALELILEAADDTTATFKTIVKVKKKKKGQPEVAEELPKTLVIPYSEIKKALIQIKW